MLGIVGGIAFLVVGIAGKSLQQASPDRCVIAEPTRALQ
ncbi:hypothetical protein XHC_3731 [Xanthomonas hortorum pv. carotae str. M081]|nr:hypothetical protein XHC_3731 [Xanthomonas hortorum pv. carotae str. M081]